MLSSTIRVAPLLLAALTSLASAGSIAAAVGEREGTRIGASAAASTIEEVVVTARRREERQQDVAIALSTISGATLEARQVLAADQLASVVPNLQFDQVAPSSGSSSAGQVFIRGIGQADFTPVTDPGVALYVDGVYIARAPGNVLDFLDVERIEVLRGPQGTLFGRNSIGGAIKVHSARPVLGESENGLRLRLGNDDLRSLTVQSNQPVGENAAAKLVLNRIQRDGYVRRSADDLRTGDRDRWSARGSLLWDLSDNVSAYAVVDRTLIDENGAPTVSGGVNDAQSFAAFGNAIADSCASVRINPAFDGSPSSGPPTFPPPGIASGAGPGCVGAGDFAGPFVSEATFPAYSELETGGAALEVDWSINRQLKLVSTTAWRSMTMLSSRDGDGTPANIFATRDDYEHEQLSQELQLAYGSEDDRLAALLGLFYFEESGFNLVDLTLPVGAIQSGGFYDNRSHALFAHGSLDLTDRLSLSLGARRSDDRKSYLPDQFVLGDASAGTPPGFFPPTWPLLEGFYLAPTGPLAAGERILDRITTSADFDNTDVLVDLSYRLAERVMAYASFSSGYKSGGFDQRFVGPTPDGRPSVYDPETVESIEIGLKSSWFGQRLRVNLALFDADYEDLQIIVRESFNPLTVNAGHASVSGGELEVSWIPAARWLVSFAAGHIDASYDRLSEAAQASGVRLGNQLANAPAWSVAVGAGFDFEVADFGIADLRLDWSWQDEEFNDAVNDPRVRQPAYDVLNASIALRAFDDRWRVALAARNLLDRTYLVAGNSAFGTAAAYVEQVYARPRETVLTLEYRF